MSVEGSNSSSSLAKQLASLSDKAFEEFLPLASQYVEIHKQMQETGKIKNLAKEINKISEDQRLFMSKIQLVAESLISKTEPMHKQARQLVKEAAQKLVEAKNETDALVQITKNALNSSESTTFDEEQIIPIRQKMLEAEEMLKTVEEIAKSISTPQIKLSQSSVHPSKQKMAESDNTSNKKASVVPPKPINSVQTKNSVPASLPKIIQEKASLSNQNKVPLVDSMADLKLAKETTKQKPEKVTDINSAKEAKSISSDSDPFKLLQEALLNLNKNSDSDFTDRLKKKQKEIQDESKEFLKEFESVKNEMNEPIKELIDQYLLEHPDATEEEINNYIENL